MLQTATATATVYFLFRSNNYQCYKLPTAHCWLFTFQYEAIISNVTNCDCDCDCLLFQFEALIINVTNCPLRDTRHKTQDTWLNLNLDWKFKFLFKLSKALNRNHTKIRRKYLQCYKLRLRLRLFTFPIRSNNHSMLQTAHCPLLTVYISNSKQ